MKNIVSNFILKIVDPNLFVSLRSDRILTTFLTHVGLNNLHQKVKNFKFFWTRTKRRETKRKLCNNWIDTDRETVFELESNWIDLMRVKDDKRKIRSKARSNDEIPIPQYASFMNFVSFETIEIKFEYHLNFKANNNNQYANDQNIDFCL